MVDFIFRLAIGTDSALSAVVKVAGKSCYIHFSTVHEINIFKKRLIKKKGGLQKLFITAELTTELSITGEWRTGADNHDLKLSVLLEETLLKIHLYMRKNCKS